jgi:hypothetical protein
MTPLLASLGIAGAILVCPPPAAASSRTSYAAQSSASTTDWIGAIAEGITALSVLLLLWQIRDSRNASKGERTSAIQERYQSDEFFASASRTVGCTSVRHAGDCVEFIKAWSNRPDARHPVLPRYDSAIKASVHDVDKTLSLFEDMGTAYNLKQLDRKTLLRSFSIPTIQIFTTAWWLICWQRSGRLGGEEENGMTETIYVEFEDMCRALKKKEVSLKRNPELRPVPEVRALCLPHGHGEILEDDEAWSSSRRLSLALSAYIRRAEQRGELGTELAGLGRSIENLPSERRSQAPVPAWEILLVPDIDQPCDTGWRQQRAAVAQLGQALARFPDYRSLQIAIKHVEQQATP